MGFSGGAAGRAPSRARCQPDALEVAKANLAGQGNIAFHYASVSDIPLADSSLDFAYSLGVLHHVPDTVGAVRHICSKLKPDAPFLIYLYYALDNRPAWFRAIWQVTNLARMGIARLPARLKLFASELIAAVIYWPIARIMPCFKQARPVDAPDPAGGVQEPKLLHHADRRL